MYTKTIGTTNNHKREVNDMAMIDKSVKIYVRKDEYGEVTDVISKNLIEFCEWYNRAKERGAKIIPNGMTSMIVITENRYFVVHVQ